MGICKTCNKKCDGEYCFIHKARKPLPSGRGLTSKKVEKTNGKNLQMKQFFLSIWKKRAHCSEVSVKFLGNEPMSTYFHHILPKSKYPEAWLDEENIILLTLDEHSNVENDMYLYDEINKRRELLKIKYGIL